MSENLREELMSQGVDYEAALERFMGKEELYQKFLIKFLKDENFNSLEEYLCQENVTEAFKCAHTIKGLSGNLGFDNLLEDDVPLVEVLRGGTVTGASDLFDNLKIKYTKLCDTIKKYA